MNPKNLGTIATVLIIPALWASGAAFALERGAELAGYYEWFLIVNLVFTVLAVVFIAWALVLMVLEAR